PTTGDPPTKEFRPLVFARHPNGAMTEWRWMGFAEPRPLYNLDKLATRPSAPVLICEGEKAADAAEKLLPGYVATTSLGRSKAAGKADWRPLHGRTVVIWPDADDPGRARGVDHFAAASCPIRIRCCRCARGGHG